MSPVLTDLDSGQEQIRWIMSPPFIFGLQNWQEFVTLMNYKAAAISKAMELPGDE